MHSGARPEIRVGYLSERADLYGGGQLSLCELAGALRGGGRIRPLVVVPAAGALSEALEVQRVEWTASPLPAVAPTLGIRALAALVRLRRLIRERGLQILHSDSPRTALYAGLAARLSEGACRHLLHLRAQRPSSVLGDRLLEMLCDRIVAVSRAAAARSAAMRSFRKMHVVPTGLPPIDFLPGPEARRLLGLPAGVFLCGVVGRVETDKGRDEALTALVAIRRAAPEALLVFLGPYDPRDPWTRTCALRCVALGMTGAVRLTGSRPEAARLLKAFDLILHPSRHEALPRVLIEAQMAAVPIVASAVGGVPEIIESGCDGALVPPGDGAALGAAAAGLASDPALRGRLAQAGLKRARERFGVERMASQITDIYDEMLRGEATASTIPQSPAEGSTTRRVATR